MTQPVGSDSEFRDSFLTGAARAFFVTAYADHVETAPERDDDFDYSKPGPRQDWTDNAPPTPPNAYALAGQLWAALHAANGEAGVYTLRLRAEEADGETPDGEDFGFSLAMQAMGQGVSWFDNHKKFPCEVPHIECSQYSFSDEAYQAE